MDPRRWWLLAVAVPALIACTAASVSPALEGLGDLAVVLVGLFSATVVWIVGGRNERAPAWRLMAVAPLFPVLGALLVAIVDPADPLDAVVLRCLPTIPGYLLAVVALLGLVERSRLRTGPRMAAEVALFLTASVVAVRLMVVGTVDWTGPISAQRALLTAAVVATSATMAAALVLMSVVEPARRRMAVVLLVGAVLLTSGRGLGTSAVLTDNPLLIGPARILVLGGLLLLALAVLLDPRGPAPAGRRVVVRAADMGQILPALALLVAVATAGAVRLLGAHLDAITWAGLVLATFLAVVHRWLSACEEHHLAVRLSRKEAYFRSLVHSGVDAVVILDDELRVTWSSQALDRILGPAAAELEGSPLLEAVHPEDRAVLAEALAAGAEHPGLVGLRLRATDGQWRSVEAGITDLRSDPDVAGVVLQCRDMTERQAREQSLQSVAYTDPATALPNRAGMLRQLEDRFRADAGDDGRGTLLLVELDGLLAAREHASRDAVGAVVAEVGRRLRATVRGEDVVARMGGGAFAVLTAGQGPDADRLAGRILSVIEQPFVTDAGIVDLTGGVGLAELDPCVDVDDLLVRVDLAVRAARAAAPGTAQRYGTELGEAAARRDRLREDLRSAAGRGQLFLLFQPAVSLADQRVAGIEAQLRWRHPEFGEIPPAEFLAIAEQAGLLGELQRFVLAEAATAAAALPETRDPIRVAVDAPAGYIATGALIADVEFALQQSGLAPERLVLEISAATVTSGQDRHGLDIATLRLMGVHVALTGFGGESSMLTDLTRLPIDLVKLDRAFVSRIDRDSRTRALCESLVGIGHALGMAVVAEGVDTTAQLTVLTGFGCDYAQGFVLARPMPIERLRTLLRVEEGALWPGMAGVR